MDQTKTGTVLVVDDNAQIRFALHEILTLSGLKVLEASDGEQAFLILEQQSVDVVIADVVMPRMSGPELFEKITQSKMECGFILLSGLAANDPTLRKFRNQSVPVIEKPFDHEQIRDLVSELLNNK